MLYVQNLPALFAEVHFRIASKNLTRVLHHRKYPRWHFQGCALARFFHLTFKTIEHQKHLNKTPKSSCRANKQKNLSTSLSEVLSGSYVERFLLLWSLASLVEGGVQVLVDSFLVDTK